MPTPDLYIALLHYPVYNKHGDVVTTAVTNLDIHDISRAARTYGVKKFFIITPFEEQKTLVTRIMDHWREGYGAAFNPLRGEALATTEIKESLEEVVAHLEEKSGGRKVNLVVTGASLRDNIVPLDTLRKKIHEGTDAYLLVFGTGWGIAGEVIERADHCIEPIRGPSDYNHLSVRSAVSIVLDRLLGIS